MKIAICDDEEYYLNRIYQYMCEEPDCSSECFNASSALLKKYEAGERYDILFLDIQMEPMNGIELAKEIRHFDANVIIVFMTSYLEYAPAGYEVNAFRYLLKPISYDDISHVMSDIREKNRALQKVIFKAPQCELILNIDDILFFETDDKETTIHYSTDTFVIRKGLNELLSELPQLLFFRIHRKYVVNLSRVREYDEKHLTLDSGQTLPISRRKSSEFRKELKNYIEKGLYE